MAEYGWHKWKLDGIALGTVYLGSIQIGTFLPDTEGTSGNIYLDGVLVGSFGPLLLTGSVYVHTVLVGTYTLAGYVPPAGVGVGPSNLIYLEKLFEIRVYISGGANYNYTRFGLKDATWQEDDPWIRILIPGGTPIRQHLGARSVEDGVLRCLDDRAVYTLFRVTDVRADSGNQYLLAPTSYAATRVIFVYKGSNVTVSTNAEAEDVVHYIFTNFRIEEAHSGIDENNEHIWEIGFNADRVERSEA